MMHKFSTAATKSSVVLCAPTARPTSAGAPDPQAGAPGLLNVPCSTFAGVDPQTGALVRLIRSALSSLRNENLCIIRTSVSEIQ